MGDYHEGDGGFCGFSGDDDAPAPKMSDAAYALKQEREKRCEEIARTAFVAAMEKEFEARPDLLSAREKFRAAKVAPFINTEGNWGLLGVQISGFFSDKTTIFVRGDRHVEVKWDNRDKYSSGDLGGPVAQMVGRAYQAARTAYYAPKP